MNVSSSIPFSNYTSTQTPASAEGIGEQRPENRRETLPPVDKPNRSEPAADRRDPPNQAQSTAVDKAEIAQQLRDQQLVTELKARDREVRAHEAAHAAVGGQHAGAPTYTYQRGPNGVNYAVGGEVSISTSAIAGDPEATLQKAQQIQRAALAPAEPSTQDRRVAAQAAQMAQQARVEISQQLEAETKPEKDGAKDDENETTDNSEAASGSTSTTSEPGNQKAAAQQPRSIANVPQLLADAGVPLNEKASHTIDQLV